MKMAMFVEVLVVYLFLYVLYIIAVEEDDVKVDDSISVTGSVTGNSSTQSAGL